MVLTGTVTRGPLVHVATVASAVTRPDAPTVLDVRWRLGGPSGRVDYDKAHIPGATFVDLDADLCGPPGPGGRHPLPDPASIEAVLRAAGVRAGHPVVVYDDGTGASAARAWWTLRWAGHAEVSVLDGGFPAWVDAGHPVTTEVPSPAPGDLTVRPGGMPVLDAAGAAALARDPDGVLLDVRTAPRYRGESEPVDPVAGHIPGAVNLPAGPVAELTARFASAGVTNGVRVGAYCGSGVFAAHAVLALHVAGRPDAALYVGSWSEWITDPARPVARS
jgi:thiosulfate/3-mercaptopyruvate sulfurtransferase